MITPTIGRIVLYTLSQEDAAAINRRRTDGNHVLQRMNQGSWPAGAMAHIGNSVQAGDVFPGIVVKVHNEDLINIKVELDGTDSLWAANVHCAEHSTPGMFHWMEYQKQRAAEQVDLSALETRINAAEDGISSTQSSITNLQQAEKVVDPQMYQNDLVDPELVTVNANDSLTTRVPKDQGEISSGGAA